MQKELINNITFDDYLGCFGSFDIHDAICKQHCSLRLLCSIESEQNIRLEMLNDLVSSDVMSMRIQ